MKKTIINFDHSAEWEAKSLIQKREFAIFTKGIVKSYTVISDLDGEGWYVGQYSIMPMISLNGTPFTKSVCCASGTFKNGKFYGNLNYKQMLVELRKYTRQFEFLPTQSSMKFMPLIYRIPKTVAILILSGKITSQEGIYKAISHKCYKDTHWKLVKECMLNCIPFYRFKIACKDIEALNPNSEIFSGNNLYTFIDLVNLAIVYDHKISCKWSAKRVSEELLHLRRIQNHEKLLAMPVIHVWSENPIKVEDFNLIDTERAAFEIGMLFDNCVHKCYWRQITAHKYIVFANNNICIGYRVMEDGDVWYDQCHGPRNSAIPNAKDIDALIRPIAQEVVNNCKIPALSNEIPY